MTAPAVTATSISRPSGLRGVLADIVTVTKRDLIRTYRLPELLIFSTIQPIMFVLLFNYVFGGAIPIPGVDYINYLIPGIIIQTATFGASTTAIGLTEDLQAGIIDRFRSLPMARSAVLAGKTLADTVRNLWVILLSIGVGYLVGFRFQTGIGNAILAIALVTFFGFVMSWVFAAMGILTKTPEAAQAAVFVPIFPFTFASSAFVPTETMPDWLQAFAENQPVTSQINAMRYLVLGENEFLNLNAGEVVEALLWSLLILVVFFFIAVRLYRRSTQ